MGHISVYNVQIYVLQKLGNNPAMHVFHMIGNKMQWAITQWDVV